MRTVVYLHGKGGNAAEAEHYRPLFPGAEVIGFDYRAETPWEAKEEFPAFFDALGEGPVTLVANSIGACFALHALSGRKLERAYFISPVTDMERLITDMMLWSGVGEEELRTRGEIPTAFGETLSWDYLSRVRANPVSWSTPTSVLRGSGDSLVSADSVRDFCRKTGADLTVMEGGEHWFHTPEQMAFLDAWLSSRESDFLGISIV